MKIPTGYKLVKVAKTNNSKRKEELKKKISEQEVLVEKFIDIEFPKELEHLKESMMEDLQLPIGTMTAELDQL